MASRPSATVIQRSLVHIHADKAAGQARIEIARKLHRVFQRLLAVVERVLNAVAQRLGDDLVLLRAQRAANRVSAQGQHQARSFLPPDAQVQNLMEAARSVGQLPFVNNEARLVLARQNLGNDLSKGTTLSECWD